MIDESVLTKQEQVLLKLILKYMGNYNNVELSYNGILYSIIIDNLISLTLTDMKWINTKRIIDNTKFNPNKKISNDLDEDCLICFNKLTKKILCNKYGNFWCNQCYYNIFCSNEGLIICPFCRDTYGWKNPKMFEIAKLELRQKMDL